MVTRVEGVINGDYVIFKRTVGNQWEAEVPASLNGIYILEMTAYDEAGNMAYTSKYMLLYDPDNLRASLIPYQYQSDLINRKYDSGVYISKYYSQIQCGLLDKQVFLSDYYAELTSYEKCAGGDKNKGCI